MKEWGPETLFVILWIGSRACAVLLLGLLIIWAGRNRQFRNAGRARGLPLMYPRVKPIPRRGFEIRIPKSG